MKIAHLLFNPFTKESRVEKELHSLARMKEVDKIVVYCVSSPGLKSTENFNEKTTLLRVNKPFCKFKGLIPNMSGVFVWMYLTLRHLIDLKPNIVHAHDLNMLPLGAVYKLLSGAKLVYDAHEFETEVQSTKGFKRIICLAIEGFFIQLADQVIVVSESIRQNYIHIYGVKSSSVILNCPKKITNQETMDREIFRKKFSIPKEHKICLYQGALIKGRGVEFLLEVFSRTEMKDYHLVFMGFGSLSQRIQETAAGFSNIHFHEAVPPQEILSYTKGADVGLCIIENVCKSYYFCLPNKLFEYIHAGIPILSSDLYELHQVVKNFGIGMTITSTEDFLNSLKNIFVSRNKIEANLRNAAEIFCWENEEQKLFQLYKKLGEVPGSFV